MRLSKIFKNVNSDLKKERNKLILEEHKKGRTDREIAKLLNIPKHTVHLVIRHSLN